MFFLLLAVVATVSFRCDPAEPPSFAVIFPKVPLSMAFYAAFLPEGIFLLLFVYRPKSRKYF